MAYMFESGEVMAGICISGWNSKCQLYIESTTVPLITEKPFTTK